jgi:hypothetical protein
MTDELKVRDLMPRRRRRLTDGQIVLIVLAVITFPIWIDLFLAFLGLAFLYNTIRYTFLAIRWVVRWVLRWWRERHVAGEAAAR